MPAGINSNATAKPNPSLQPPSHGLPDAMPGGSAGALDTIPVAPPPSTEAHTATLASMTSFFRQLDTRCNDYTNNTTGMRSQDESYQRPGPDRRMFMQPPPGIGGQSATSAPSTVSQPSRPHVTNHATIETLCDPMQEADLETLRTFEAGLWNDPKIQRACADIHNTWRALVSSDEWKTAMAGGLSMTLAHAAELALLAIFKANPVMRVVAVTQPYVAMVFLQSYLKGRLGYVDPDPGNRAPPSGDVRAINSLVNWNAVQPFIDAMADGHKFKPIIKALASGGLMAVRNLVEHKQTVSDLARLPKDAPAGPPKLTDLENAVVEFLGASLRNTADLPRQIIKTSPGGAASSKPWQNLLTNAVDSSHYPGGVPALIATGYIPPATDSVNSGASGQEKSWRPGPERQDEKTRFSDPFDPFNN